MNRVALSWRQARREFRAGELRTLGAALVIAVAALTAVAAFGERVERGLKQSANELLGGDLVVVSRLGIEDDWEQEAQRRGLATARSVEFPTVAFAGERSMLVQLKAVTPNYPLRGALEVAGRVDGPAQRVSSGPPRGEVWVETRVLLQLDTQIGGLLELGDQRFELSRLIRVEPDRAGFFDLAPRVMIHHDALADSGLLGPGSRASYRLLVAGEPGVVADYQAWLQPQLEGAYFQTLERSQRQLSRALDRAERFLGLAALSAVLLAGVALVIAARQFALGHYDTVAILRCLGASQWETMAVMALELLWVALPAIALGVAGGYLAQMALVTAMGTLIPQGLPAAGLQPALAGVSTGLLALFGFALPPLARLRRVPPARVLKQDTGPPGRELAVYLVPLVISLALVFVQSGDPKLGLIVTVGLAVTLAAVAVLAGLLLIALRRTTRAGGIGWRYGLANVGRRRAANLFQIAALAVGAMMILLLSTIQSDLLASWRHTIPDDAPNYFMINIQPHQVEDVRTALDRRGLSSRGIYPMAVGKIVAVNGQAVSEDGVHNRLDRTINLSWAEALPAANRIVAGHWWADPAVSEVSLVDTWAEERGVSLGDRLRFRVGERDVELPVTSLREVAWDSFEANFFIVISPGAAADMPASYIGSVHVPGGDFAALGTLVRAWPNITVIDIGSILERVREIIDRVTLTVRVVFVFTLVAGILVLLSALRSGLGERIYEGGVLRALGGSRAQLRQAVIAEYAVIGALSGGLAAAASLAVGWAVARFVFEIPWLASWELLPLGLGCGAILIAAVGLYGSRRVLTTPPVVVLRGGA